MPKRGILPFISFPFLYICVLDKKYIFRVNLYERRNQKEQLFSR